MANRLKYLFSMACGQNLDNKGVRGGGWWLQGMACCRRLFAFRTGLVADWVYCAPDGGNCRQGWEDFFAGLRERWGWRCDASITAKNATRLRFTLSQMPGSEAPGATIFSGRTGFAGAWGKQLRAGDAWPPRSPTARDRGNRQLLHHHLWAPHWVHPHFWHRPLWPVWDGEAGGAGRTAVKRRKRAGRSRGEAGAAALPARGGEAGWPELHFSQRPSGLEDFIS